MIKEVLKLLMGYKGMSSVFGGDLEADVGRRLATCDGLPFFRESEGMRLAVVMKTLFDLRLVTALGGDEEGEVYVNCDRVMQVLDVLDEWEGEDLEAQRAKDHFEKNRPLKAGEGYAAIEQAKKLLEET